MPDNPKYYIYVISINDSSEIVNDDVMFITAVPIDMEWQNMTVLQNTTELQSTSTQLQNTIELPNAIELQNTAIWQYASGISDDLSLKVSSTTNNTPFPQHSKSSKFLFQV